MHRSPSLTFTLVYFYSSPSIILTINQHKSTMREREMWARLYQLVLASPLPNSSHSPELKEKTLPKVMPIDSYRQYIFYCSTSKLSKPRMMGHCGDQLLCDCKTFAHHSGRFSAAWKCQRFNLVTFFSFFSCFIIIATRARWLSQLTNDLVTQDSTHLPKYTSISLFEKSLFTDPPRKVHRSTRCAMESFLFFLCHLLHTPAVNERSRRCTEKKIKLTVLDSGQPLIRRCDRDRKQSEEKRMFIFNKHKKTEAELLRNKKNHQLHVSSFSAFRRGGKKKARKNFRWSPPETRLSLRW